MEEKIDKILAELELLNQCTIQNGGGRHVTYERQEFNQMIYDRGKMNVMADKIVKYSAIAIIFIQSILLTKDIFFK